MQDFIWVRAVAEVFAPSGRLQVLVLKDGGRVKAAAPLFLRGGEPCLELLGVSTLFEPADAVWADDAALHELARALASLGRPLSLKRIPESSALPRAVARAFRGRGVLISRPDAPWPFITLDPGWADPESKFGSKRRAYLRRARRLAEESGAVSYEALTPTPENFDALYEQALAVEAAGWKGDAGTSLRQDPLRGEFYRRYAQAACRKGVLRLCFLRVGGETAAMQLAVEDRDRFWLLKIGYREKFSHCSPGNLLIRESVAYAAQKGLKTIAFLGLMEPWKKQWTEEESPCVILRGYPWGIRAAARLARDVAGYAWQKLVKK
jgi:CelD/BcsL family acetyltransferase involved in cellulose biosynthesis